MRILVTTFLALVILSLPGGAVAASDSSHGAPAAEAPAIAFDRPAWSAIPTRGGPAAREDHTWTVDGDGRFAYLYGGRDGATGFGDLWRFDLQTDSWRELTPDGRAPGARFGHSAVWADGHGLVVFAGQRGTDFLGDLWAYDPTTDSWQELPARGFPPKARYGSCMVMAPDGRLDISHGFTFAGRFDDTRAYDLRSRRWASVAPKGRRPGARCLHDCFMTEGGQLVLYGGQDNDHAALGDLWLTREDGTWRRLTDPAARPRRLYAVSEAGSDAWIFGGAGEDGAALDDLWRVDRVTLEFERVAVAGDSPSARYAATLVADAARGRLLLFGGRGKAARGDLWALTESDAG